jgi:hypothetical protein
MDLLVLEKEALLLPDNLRAMLAERLIESISPLSSEIKKEWIQEAEARMEAFERGEIESVEGSTALASLRQKLAR